MTVHAMGQTAHARTADPSTSHEAAALVTNLPKRQSAVLAALTKAGRADYTRLWQVYRSGMTHRPDEFPTQTEQSVRSRAAELRHLGLVRDTGERTITPNGRSQKVWEVVA